MASSTRILAKTKRDARGGNTRSECVERIKCSLRKTVLVPMDPSMSSGNCTWCRRKSGLAFFLPLFLLFFCSASASCSTSSLWSSSISTLVAKRFPNHWMFSWCGLRASRCFLLEGYESAWVNSATCCRYDTIRASSWWTVLLLCIIWTRPSCASTPVSRSSRMTDPGAGAAALFSSYSRFTLLMASLRICSY